MRYSELTPLVFAVSTSGYTSYIEGDAGIGKTQMVKEIKKMYEDEGYKCNIVTLFGALLKEGELGGIPVPHEVNGKMVSDYTTHVKLQELADLSKEENSVNVLFIDELNRAEIAVQQELMQLILDRRINQTFLPDNVVIIAAGNPRATDANDYQVYEMNSALINRFFYFKLDANVEDWLKWALSKKKDEDYIEEDIIEFISEYPNMLHQPEIVGDIKPTPRGWEMFSSVIKQINNWFPSDNEDMIHKAGKGIVGDAPALSFIQFRRNKENPLVKVEELFGSEEKVFNNAIERLKKESGPRLYVTVDKIITYISDHSDQFEKPKSGATKAIKTANEEIIGRLSTILNSLPKDFMIGIFKDMVDNHKEIYNILVEHEEFVDIFFNVYKRTIDGVGIK